MPGTTSRSRTSMARVPRAASMVGAIRAIPPSRTATSSAPSRPWAGSMTRPPRRIRSNRSLGAWARGRARRLDPAVFRASLFIVVMASSARPTPPAPDRLLGHGGQGLDAHVLHLALDHARLADVQGGNHLVVLVEAEGAHRRGQPVAGPPHRF